MVPTPLLAWKIDFTSSPKGYILVIPVFGHVAAALSRAWLWSHRPVRTANDTPQLVDIHCFRPTAPFLPSFLRLQLVMAIAVA